MIFGREPAAISLFISLGVKALILFNVIQWTPEQEIGLMALVDSGLFLLVRQVVTPVSAPKLDPGTTVTPTDGGAKTTIQ